ncbi:MAG: lipoyl synthase [Thermoplasmata archaeon]|nr:lipoyl synthase [Thermoplasmata archaeon]
MASAASLPNPPAPLERLPGWIRVRPPGGVVYPEVRGVLRELGLGTVCQEARCPNLPECWSSGHATIMLLGTECSRRCTFCAVATRSSHGKVDATEPARVAEAVRAWGLRYIVLTQVCRDDLPDGGAAQLAETVDRIRAVSPTTQIELLAGDLAGNRGAWDRLLARPPDVVAHNLETVRRLSPELRDRRASYDRSLEVLRWAKGALGTGPVTKSSLMLGLGESEEELEAAFRDLRDAGVDLLTLGQYLRPSPEHRAVHEYVTPEQFERLKARALAEGFAGVEAGPLVRSSYHAGALYDRAIAAAGGR